VIRIIIKIPTNKAINSFTDCQKPESSNNSGITETVAMYIKPPAVNGRTQLDAAASANPLGSADHKEMQQPNNAPIAVTSCNMIAFRLLHPD